MPDPAHQKSPHGNGNGAPTVVGSIAGFGNSVATLVELQAQLAAVDLKDASARATWPLVFAVLGLVIIVGCVPVALLGLATVLASGLNIPVGVSMLLTAIVFLLLSGAVIYFATRRFLRSLDPLRRSREELVRNISWLRTVMVHSGRPLPKRGL